MIEVPGQPIAQRALTAALAAERPAQQLLIFGPPGTGKREAARRVAWQLVDPRGGGDPWRASLDITVLAATGQNINLDALEPALADLSARPAVGERRVLIVEGAERLKDENASRMLKILEEPPSRSHVLLVTDRVADLLPTIRSRCLPVPFRTPGWRAIAAELRERGVPAEEAEALARSDGPQALTASPFTRRMRAIGTELGRYAVCGGEVAMELVASLQREMVAAARDSPSDDLLRLRADAADKAGRRGERTALKKVEDQEKREARKAVNDGWAHVLDGAAVVVADAIAVANGAEGAVRHRELLGALRDAAVPARRAFLERAADEIQVTRAELELNPTMDLQIEALLARVHLARRGTPGRLTPPGRLPA